MSADNASHQDFTKGPIGPAIFALAVPMILEMLMESIFAVVDIFFVGKIGAEAVATVGLTESMMSLIYTVAMGLSVGAAAVTARRIGEGDRDGAAIAAVQSLILGLFVSLAMGIGGYLYAEEILALMGATPAVIEHGVTYTRIMLGSNAVVVLLFLANAAFRGAGDAWIAMRSLWLANAINLILCPLLVFGFGDLVPGMGVTGAAISTAAARGAGCLYVIWKMLSGGGRLHVRREHLEPAPVIMGSIARLSGSGTFQILIATASWIGLMRVMSNFGSEALAGYTIGIRLIVFALMPAFGLGNAAATLVGQSLGAKDPERAARAVWISSFYSAVFLGVVGILFFIFADPLVAQFTKEVVVHEYAVLCLRILACSYPFFAYGMVVSQAFNGAGDTWTPTWINFGVFWLFEIPLAWVLAIHWDFGPRGLFYAVTISFALLAVVSAYLFQRGGWKTKMV